MQIAAYSIVPSPYQRDFFAAIAQQIGEKNLQIYYLEHSAPDSPWPKQKLRPYEKILPGLCLGRGRVRSHINLLPQHKKPIDAVLVNLSLTDLTTQLLLRKLIKNTTPWLYWAEILRAPQRNKKEKIRQLLQQPLSQANAIIGIGNEAKRSYQQLFPTVPIFENIPYHCDLAPYQNLQKKPQNNNSPAETTFLFCGQMIPRKGIDILIQSFDQLTKNGANARLRLVGRDDQIEKHLAPLSASTREKIDLIGFIAPENLPQQFAQADIFILPSRHDGWGVVVNQAIAAGLPIIASDGVRAAVELIESEKNGLIVPAGDTTALTAAMQKLSANQPLQKAMGQHSVQKIAPQLTPQAGAAKMLKILQTIAKK